MDISSDCDEFIINSECKNDVCACLPSYPVYYEVPYEQYSFCYKAEMGDNCAFVEECKGRVVFDKNMKYSFIIKTLWYIDNF